MGSVVGTIGKRVKLLQINFVSSVESAVVINL